MHIEKNVFDNCYGTIFNLEGKTKDILQARRNLVEMNIREELHPQQNLQESCTCHQEDLLCLKVREVHSVRLFEM
jgi:hypothetical protein